MGVDIPQKQNEICERFNSFFQKNLFNDYDSLETLKKKINNEFTFEELIDIQKNSTLNDFFIIQKNKILNDLKREREHRIKLNEFESIINKNTKALEAQKREYKAQNDLIKKESNQTIKYLEKKIDYQKQEYKNREEEYKRENARKMAVMNEQHNKIVENLKDNVREQEKRLYEQQKENERKMAVMNDQHNKTIENLRNNAFEQEKRFNEQQENLTKKFKQENAETKSFFEQKLYEQEKEQKAREQQYKEENEKKMALLNEQHNKTIEIMKQKLIEQDKLLKEREEKFRLENEKKEKEANERIALMIEQHNNNIKSLEDKAREQERKFEENQKKKEEEFKKTMEDLEKRYKEERDEEKRQQILMEQKKLEELNQKKKQIIDDFDDKFNKRIANEIEDIITNFNSNEDKFCIEDISKFDKNKINTLIKSLLKFEKINNSIMKQLNLIMEDIQLKNVEHLNIVLVGPSGVGKSTLINTLLELELKTKYGFGYPQTQGMDAFTSDKIPFLRLVDSKGIEKNIDSGTDATYNSIKDYINERIKTGDPDQYIHCIWYCWTGSRLEKTEIDIVKKLSEHYTLDTLPVISVYTNSINKSYAIEAKKYITETLKLPIEFVDILSVEAEIDLGDKIIIKPAYGLDKLKEVSIKLAKSAVNSACYEGLTKDIEKKINNQILELNVILKGRINELVKDIISKMTEDSKLEDFYKDYISIILNLFYKYLFIDPEITIEDPENPEINFGEINLKISDDNKILIKNFIIEYFKDCMKSLDNNVKKILKEQSEKISKEIYDFQLEYNVSHENLLVIKTQLEFQDIIKREINNKLHKKAKLSAFKNAFLYLVTPFIEVLGNYFNECYKKGMEKKKFKEKINEIIKMPFNKIEEKIKEHEERKKKEEEERKKKEEEERKKKEEEERKKKEEEEKKKKEEEGKTQNENNNIQEAPTPTPNINVDDLMNDEEDETVS